MEDIVRQRIKEVLAKNNSNQIYAKVMDGTKRKAVNLIPQL